MVSLGEDQSIRTWRSRIRDSTFETYASAFKGFMDSLEATKFKGFTPDGLIEHQHRATKDTEYEILDVAQTWANSRNDLRRGTKGFMLKAVKSFFDHNRASLPRDKSFKLRSEVPPVPTLLKSEEIRQVCLKSNRTFRAAFMVMFTSFLDQESFVFWSDTGRAEMEEQLQKGDEVIRIRIAGRKGTRNEEWFTTYLGGDGLKALKDYLEERGREPGPIFVNQFGDGLTKNALTMYWLRKLRELGLLIPQAGSTERYGKGLHNLRDVARSLWARSGVDGKLAEAFMGHLSAVDPYGYNQSHRDEGYAKGQYRKVLPFLNLLSSDTPFGKVDAEELERLREQVQRLQTQKDDRMEALEAKVERYTAALGLLYNDPELAAKLKKTT